MLADYRTAPIDERLRATLGYLEKLTLAPETLGPADARALRDLGLDDDAIREAAWVAVAFNVIDRIADGLGFDVPDAAAFDASARMLLRRGYEM